MRRRVMHVAHSLNLGGAERLAARIATTLSDEFEIIVACLDAAGLWAREVRDAGVPVIELFRQPGIDIVVPVRIAALARRHRVGLFHAHQYSPYFYALLAHWLAPRTRVLFHEHGRHYPEIESTKRIAVNKHLFSRFTHRVVAVSQDVKERVIRYEGLPSELIEVVYNGTEAPPPASEAVRGQLRDHLGLGAADLVMGTVGRLDPVKNIPLAIGSLAALLPTYPALKLLVIGDGPARAEIIEYARARGVADSLVMTGFRDDAAELVRCLDIFLLPSLTEGTSLALVGAMAAGIPAVATAVGGNPEVIDDGRSGRLVASQDQDGLTSAIRELIENPELARTMGLAGRDSYLARFTYTGMIDSLRRIYREELALSR